MEGIIERGFKGVWIPAEIWLCRELTMTQKFLLVEIDSLSKRERGCTASNSHFAELLGITAQGVSKALIELERTGWIAIDNSNTKRNFGRVLTISKWPESLSTGVESLSTGVERTINWSLESKGVIQENNTEEKESSAIPCPHDEILDLWKQTLPTLPQPIKSMWKKRQPAKHLAERWKEGFRELSEVTGKPYYTDKQTGIEWWRKLFAYIGKSDFLMNNHKGMGLDWIVKPENYAKLREGKYHRELKK